MLRSIFTFLSLTLAGSAVAVPQAFTPESRDVDAPVAAAGEWSTWVDQEFVVPPGLNYGPIFEFLGRPAHVDAVKAELFSVSGSSCLASVFAIDLATTANQRNLDRLVPDADGVSPLPDSDVYRISVVLQQSSASMSTCVLRVSGLAPATAQFELLGAIRYEGGFRSPLDFAVDPTRKMTRLRLKVPQFCADLDLLDVGTVAGGGYVAAEVVNDFKRIYTVNGAEGLNVEAIRLVVNGPLTTMCDVPVYAQFAP